MSHQQNPLPVSQQTGNSEASDVVKPFSIRQYVLACRHKSVSHSWPFPNKYLQMCLKDVLPPFESFKGCSSNLVKYSRNDHDSKQLAHELCKAELVQRQEHVEPNCNVSVNFSESIHVHKSLSSLVSSKVMKDKRKRRKGRCKKRSLVDILAVARHCYTDQTVTEAYQHNKNISN